ncbi:MAG: asparagine synthase (glutamine-hydrolyzing) [Candidatus Binatia bacterium]
MCGICGWIRSRSLSGEERSTLERMNATLAHRGPDDAGTVIFDDAALAMSRLSIIDLTTGHQPIANEAKTCWIVYNGEIYNFLDLRWELENRGYRFQTRSDTEVILHAYEEWGPDCVRHLRGMFAFAIYDRRLQSSNHSAHPPTAGGRLFLARDRVGKKPLYYYADAERFLFASETKALLAHPTVPRRINRRVIPLYLAYGYVPAPSTIFEGICELPPGHTVIVQDGRVTVQSYWEVPGPIVADGRRSEQEYIERLRELFAEAVRIRLISDVPLGAFLSGGLDSTAIVAFMARLMDQPVKTFAIGFADDPSFNELEYARLAARTYGTDHHEFIVRPDAIDLLPKLVWHHDQPFADSSAIPTYLVAKLSREHVTVALTGDGGDELFAGYERFAAARLAEAYRRTPQFVQATLAHLFHALPESTDYAGFVRRVRRFIEHAPLPLAQRYLGWVGIFDASFLGELLADEIEGDPVGHFSTYFGSLQDQDPLNQLLAVNIKTYLPGDLLVKTDRMSMANSLETRCPFLDQALLEFAACIPSDLKLKGFTTKYILKKALAGLVPREIIRRKKHGFGVPVGRWFRTSLKEYVRDILLSPQALRRGYFKEGALRQLIEEHQSGKRDHGHRLWALLTFEVWHQVFLDQTVSFSPLP